MFINVFWWHVLFIYNCRGLQTDKPSMCHGNFTDCPGHWILKLTLPVFNIGTFWSASVRTCFINNFLIMCSSSHNFYFNVLKNIFFCYVMMLLSILLCYDLFSRAMVGYFLKKHFVKHIWRKWGILKQIFQKNVLMKIETNANLLVAPRVNMWMVSVMLQVLHSSFNAMMRCNFLCCLQGIGVMLDFQKKKSF